MSVVKCEIVDVEDYTYKVTDGFCGNVFVAAFLKEKTASLNSFVVRDVSVK